MKKTAVNKTLALFLSAALLLRAAAKRAESRKAWEIWPETAIKPWEDMWRKK